jgi:hypothetical protein
MQMVCLMLPDDIVSKLYAISSKQTYIALKFYAKRRLKLHFISYALHLYAGDYGWKYNST